MPDQRVIDDALQSPDRILKDAGPGNFPHGGHDGAVHNRTIELLAFLT
jgi:hypothetical protein